MCRYLFIHCENNGEDVWFSPLYVERITNNLLSNALKFTPANGKVVVKAEILNKPDGYIYLRIEVSDTGIGIVKEEIQNIFSKYYQTKRGHNVNNKGWGIGLALVKRLTEIHKGSISVDSTIGKGSSFVVYLNVSAEAFDPKVCISGDKTIVPLSKYVYDEPSDSGNSEKTRLIVNREQLFARHLGQRIQARAGTARQNNSLHQTFPFFMH